MRLLATEREQVAGVAERWKAQYCREGKWGGFSGDPEGVYRRLIALGQEGSAADVAAAIGNDSWIGETCNECGKEKAVILVGEEPDYETSTVYLCVACAERIQELAGTAVA